MKFCEFTGRKDIYGNPENVEVVYSFSFTMPVQDDLSGNFKKGKAGQAVFHSLRYADETTLKSSIVEGYHGKSSVMYLDDVLDDPAIAQKYVELFSLFEAKLSAKYGCQVKTTDIQED